MRRAYAIPIAIVLWLSLAALAWSSLIGVNLGVVCGRVLAPWAYAAEAILFAPTIWLTRPLDQWLEIKHLGLLITLGSVIETALLATLYSGIVYLLLRRTPAASYKRGFRRFVWPLTAVLVVMIVSSIWLRAQLRAEDYAAPLTHETEKVVPASVRTPAVATKIELAALRKYPVDELVDRYLIAREGAPPISIAVRETYIREPRFRSESAYVIHRLTPDHAEKIAELPLLGDGSPIGEPRCAYGTADEVLVSVSGVRRDSNFLLSIAQPELLPAPAGLGSMQALRTSDGVVFVGFGGNSDAVHAEGADWLRLDTHAEGGDLSVLRQTGGRVDLLGVVPSFSDHGLNNAAAAFGADGLLHIIATEVAVAHENSSIVHHLKFDTRRKKWAGHEALMAHPGFTSTATPRLARAGDALDAFWDIDGRNGATTDGGLYARRLGENDVWRLTTERCEFVVLENADGQGGTLVAAATHPSESGIVHWYYRDGATWSDLGATDAGETLYTMNNIGTDPFVLWRGSEPGIVHAAFNAIKYVVIEDVRLPVRAAPVSPR